MKINKNTLIISGTFLIFTFIFSFLIPKFFQDLTKIKNNKASEVYKESSYSGLVLNKYIDSTQHNYKTIIIRNNTNCIP